MIYPPLAVLIPAIILDKLKLREKRRPDPCGRQGGGYETTPMDVETLALEENVTDGFRSVAATAVGRILNLGNKVKFSS